jgi:hypothetical protein
MFSVLSVYGLIVSANVAHSLNARFRRAVAGLRVSKPRRRRIAYRCLQIINGNRQAREAAADGGG